MLEEKEIEENYNTFITLIRDNIKREGVENLLNWLAHKDLKIAPASTKFHMSCKGGLVKHSLNVYNRLKQLIKIEFPDMEKCPYTEETITLVSLLHDISKVNFYDLQMRNTKDEKGNWVQVPYYSVKPVENRLIFGSHSMNSYYMLSTFFKLSYEEGLAILHHMGGTDPSEDTISIKNVFTAFEKSKLAVLLHIADLMATTIDEVGTAGE